MMDNEHSNSEHFVLDENKTKKAMEYCDICLLSWQELWSRYESPLAMDLKKSHLHDSLAEMFDVDRDFIEFGMEKTEVQYKKDFSIEKAYDKFINYLKDVAEMPICERHRI